MKKLNYLQIYNEEHVQNGLSYKQIREKYSIPRGTWDYYIRKKLNKVSDRRKYRCNDTFFDIIDCEIKAYLLGFLYADGYITSDFRIGILLNEKDREILELIQKYIAPNSIIYQCNYQNIKRDPQVKIRFKSKQLYQKLLDYGFVIDKTHSNKNILKTIPEPFKKDFIRGYTDGDGNIRFCKGDSSSTSKWYNCSYSLCNGTPKILEEIQQYFSPIVFKFKIHNTWCTLTCHRQQDLHIIYTILYKNAAFYLKRKYENAINSLCYFNNTELIYKTKEL